MQASGKEVDYSELFDVLPVGIICLDSQRKIISTNNKARTLLGFDSKELSDQREIFKNYSFIRPDMSVIPEQDLPFNSALVKGELVSDIILGLKKKSEPSILWLNMSVTPKFNGDDQEPVQVVLMFKDISNRVNQIRSLKESEGTFKALVDKMQSALMII